MKKYLLNLKNFFKKHGSLILGLGGFLSTVLLGFLFGSRKRERELKREKVSVIKKEAENVILKEKIADRDKTLNEISEDIDNILDHK